MTVGKIMIAKFARGDSITPEEKDLNRNTVPSWVKEITLAKILPINSNIEEIKGAFKINSAKINCISNPFKTNFLIINIFLI